MQRGIASGLKKARDDNANVRTADMEYIPLPYRLDKAIFENNVIVPFVVGLESYTYTGHT